MWWLLLLACARGDGAGDATGTPNPITGEALAVAATPGAVPNVLTVQWSAEDAEASWVEYGLDGALDQRTPEVAGAAPSVVVLGLKSTRSYQWRAVSRLSDGTTRVSAAATYEVPPPPPGLPPVAIEQVDPAQSVMAGRWLLTQFGGLDQSWAVILDEDGDYVWALAFPVGIQISHVAVAHDRQSLWIAQMDREQVQDLSRVYRYALDGTPLSDTRLPTQHHVVIEQTSGSLAFLAHTTRDVVQPSGETWPVLTDEIRTIGEGSDGSDYDARFHYLDDWMPFSVPCPHVAETESWLGTDGWHEWTHSNSLIESPDESALYVAPRLHDALLQLDAETFAVRWQLGGVDSDFTVAPDPSIDDPVHLWSHGHLNDAWEGGMLMFDNAIHATTHGSRAQEWAIDDAQRTAELVWTYADPDGAKVPLLGDVRRAPDGHRLVTWTTFGAMTEHIPGVDAPVWRLDLPVGTVIGRPTLLDGLYGLVEAPKE